MIGPLYTGFHREFPGLPSAALDFFHPNNASISGQSLNARTTFEFAESVKKPTGGLDQYSTPSLHHLASLLGRMADLNLLEVIAPTQHPHAGDGSYLCVLNAPFKDEIKTTIDFLVYGFPVIYEEFKKSVVPIIHESPDGRQQVGTAFLTRDNTILTAAHCILDAARISIMGITPREMATAEVATSANQALDIAAINFKGPVLYNQRPIELGSGKILQDVLTMGYPNVPAFATTLAVEKAAISGRLTATQGSIASKPHEIFSKTELFLVTARVRGGFSGGPVINGAGTAIGIISRTPASGDAEDNVYAQYDNLGYGVAIPSEEVVRFLRGCAAHDASIATFTTKHPEYVEYSDA